MKLNGLGSVVPAIDSLSGHKKNPGAGLGFLKVVAGAGFCAYSLEVELR